VTLLAVAAKDLRLALRDWGALLFTMVVPIIVTSIVALGVSGGDSGPVLFLPVVNGDQGPVAEVLLEALAEHARIEEVDLERATEIVRVERGAAAALVLPEHLSKRYLADEPSELQLLTDPAKGTELAMIRATLLLADREAASLADPFSEELLEVREQSLTGSNLTVSSFAQTIPGFSLMFVLMGVLFGVAFGLDDERTSGTLLRLRAAPAGTASWLGGKLLARYAIGVFQIALLFGFGHLVFDLSLGASLFAFAICCAAIVYSMTGFSLLVASVLTTREQIIPAGLTVIMVVCSLGGCWWPLFQAPLFLQRLAHAFLTAWSMDGLQDLIARDAGLLQIAPTLGVLVGYGTVSLALGVWITRRRLEG